MGRPLRAGLAVSAAAAIVLALVPGSLRGCLWDSDTVAQEAKGLPDVVRILTGRFEQNPPLYYAMRAERAAAQVASDPDNFAAYDDAGVACDRLGLGDRAIEWMETKRERLEAKGWRDDLRVRDAWYRYYANVGTFWVHRWARDGADRGRIDEVKTARDFIVRAIEINPNAHFGRERYQLQALEWLVNPPQWDGQSTLPTFLDAASLEKDPKGAVQGLGGLVALGNAWESVDVFNALAQALTRAENRTSLSFWARWRCEELIDQGKGSLMPGAPTGPALKEALFLPDGMLKEVESVKLAFRQHRAEADAWQRKRTAFMLKRLREGRHPDTDPSFWNGYVDPGAPPFPGEETPAKAGWVPVILAGMKGISISGPLVRIGLVGIGFVAVLVLVARSLIGRRGAVTRAPSQAPGRPTRDLPLASRWRSAWWRRPAGPPVPLQGAFDQTSQTHPRR